MEITMTGFDEHTSNFLVKHILGRYGIEMGVLYTFDPEGRNRYPSPKWIDRFVREYGRNAALHICGGRARKQLLAGELKHWTDRVGRVQVNGHVTEEELIQISRMVRTVITQHDPMTMKNVKLFSVPLGNHEILVDGSGGEGKLPLSWVRPVTWKKVGFAGGLGPDTLTTELPKIQMTANQNYFWIDMEGKLRNDDDRFDVEKAVDALSVIAFPKL